MMIQNRPSRCFPYPYSTSASPRVPAFHVGKTALPDMTVHLDPDFAKHRAGREVMQRLEDTFGEPGVDGPGVEIGQRLAMWPLKCATWSRAAYKAGEGSQPLSQAEPERQTVDYMLIYFTVHHSFPLASDGTQKTSYEVHKSRHFVSKV